MLDTSTYCKNKVELSDYNYKRDINNRRLVSKLSSNDIIVLEEILYSPLKFSIDRLVKNTGLEKIEVKAILEKLKDTELFTIDDTDTIHVEKQLRKYFESLILMFEDDFKPDMDFLQSLLKKVPIQILPQWYPIPRSSNSIFESIVEKFLSTPQIFQRYYSELQLDNLKYTQVMADVFESPTYKMTSNEIIEKHNLSLEEFEECMLYLEFNFVCCLSYEKIDDSWQEIVTPFHEWKEYLSFLKDTTPQSIPTSNIKRKRPHDFSFALDMSTLLKIAKSNPIPLVLQTDESWQLDASAIKSIAEKLEGFSTASPEEIETLQSYVSTLIQKLLFLKLATVNKSHLEFVETAVEWLILPVEKRALSVYRHTLKNFNYSHFSPPLVCSERTIHEIEKNLVQLETSVWVDYNEFCKGIVAPLTSECKVQLKKIGRNWKYTLPSYTDLEDEFISLVLQKWLFEAGLITLGKYDDKDCFCITPLGKTLFG